MKWANGGNWANGANWANWATWVKISLTTTYHIYFIGSNLLGGYEMDVALREFLIPKLKAADIDIMSPEYKHLYLLFMRKIKEAKEMLTDLEEVCNSLLLY